MSTKTEMFRSILALSEVSANPKMVDFLNHEIDLLAHRKSSTKPTKTQRENADIKVKIAAYMVNAGIPVRVSDVAQGVGISTEKCNALVRQMVLSGDVVRSEVKRVAYFSLTDPDGYTDSNTAE